MVVHSLSRFRKLKPRAPFRLGGEYLRHGEQHFLTDAEGMIELKGYEELFRGLNPGDLATAQVIDAAEFEVQIDQIRVEFRCVGNQNKPNRPHVSRFSAFVTRLRDYFLEQGLNEVFTPSLVKCPGLEPTLEAFSTEIVYGRKKAQAYLPTSPEIHLKKALARGYTDIFEIKSCYRRGESSAHHEPEFLMLEWYRGFADLEMIIADLQDLVAQLTLEGWIEGRASKILVTDFATLFRDMLDFELTPDTSEKDLRRLCSELDIHCTADDSFNDLFHRLMIDRIEPQLATMGPVIVRRFPPSQAALAKLDAEGWADRFEFYWQGLEIANAFNEVNDADEQKQRWLDELEERRRIGTGELPMDQDLIEALKKGIPPTGGIAMGVERLYMACAGVRDIKELRLFSAMDLLV